MGYVEDLKDSKHGRGRNRWRARWRDPAGRQRTRSFARMVDAERFLLGVEDAKLRGAYVDPAAGKVNFGEWAERWYKTTAGLNPSTRHTYRQLLDYQILPTFQKATLAGVDMLLVREWLAALVEAELSPSPLQRPPGALPGAGDSGGGEPAGSQPGQGGTAATHRPPGRCTS